MNGASIDRDWPERRSRVTVRAGLCLCTIVCGLALRGVGPGLGLSAFVVKYGGSLLWGTMVFFLVALAAANLPRRSIALISVLIAISVELFRLVHAPWLDAFRLTLPGALLLGRIFSAWNVLAYGVGIGFGVLLDRRGCGLKLLTPPAETARTGAVLPRSGASTPCAGPWLRRRRPSSISAPAICGSGDRS
jgi:Protein of unknown function (DUF2809)